MSDSQNFGFAKLVPGFDFLQNLAKGTTETLPQMPSLSSWVAPTLNPEELEKRIQELRAVHFWLEQNSKALSATIQALEVQKMTLATLAGMNCSMADLAQALKVPVPRAAAPTPAPAPAAAQEPVPKATRKTAAKPGASPDAAAAGAIDPMQWWGSLTEQFQHIAASAMQDAAQQAADTARAPAAPAPAAAPAARKAAARKKPAARASARRGGG